MEDELTLMEIFKVLARRWKLIVAITLIATIVVAGVLLFAIKPTFTSRATVVVSQENVVPQDLGQLATLMVSQPVTTAATYVDIARDPGLYRGVIEQLQLSGEPWRLTASTLAQAVKVTSAIDAKATNMIAIEVKLQDKDLAAAVANALAEQLVKRGKEIMVTEQLNSYRAYLRPLLVDIPAQQTALAAKQAALVGVPKVLTTTKSIVNDQTLLDVAKAVSNQSVLDLARLSMVSQEVNPLWESLTTDVSRISADITTKTGLKALCQQIIAQLESPSTNDDSLSPIRIEQRAVPADEKDAGGRAVKLAVTMVAALFLSILLSFLVDYVQAAHTVEAAARRPQGS
jgi:capsular polysaccharide biosynthesis protein